MQEFNTFDMVIVTVTVLLALKGLFRGFIKEVFSLIAIVGAIFVASRMADPIGNSVAPMLALEHSVTKTIVGFILCVIVFWAAVYLLGIIISKIFELSGLGFFDRILGFVFAGAKIFLIFSILAYLVIQIKAFNVLASEKIKGSIVLPVLVKTGGFVFKIDPSIFIKKEEKKKEPEADVVEGPDVKTKSIAQELTDTVKEMKQKTIESGTTVIDTVKKTVNEKVDKMAEEMKDVEIKEETPAKTQEPKAE